MALKPRNVFIGVLALVAVIAIYSLYNRAQNTPPIDIDTGAEFIRTVARTDINQPTSRGGTVGDVGVGAVKKAKFTDLNQKTGRIEREFGFDAVLHEEGDQWELEKPYMNFYRRNFKCFVTADKGNVRVETVGKKTSPKDATLTGNVVIRILPGPASSFKKSFLYLDDITFTSERSYFSTAGPVRFVSQQARMLGEGLEGVYSNELERLEYLRIVHLESLRLRTSEGALFGEDKTQTKRPSQTTGPTQTQSPTETPADTKQTPKRKGEYYKWLFSKNVLINTPDQIILADEEISISSMFWAKDPNEEPAEPDISDANDSGPAPAFEQTLVAARADSAHAPEEHPKQQLADIVVTCDNGILITPMSSTRLIVDFASEEHKPQPSGASADGGPTAGRTRLTAAKIDYSASSGDTLAAGPLEIVFDINDPVGDSNNTVPVRVTARDEAQFLPASNRVILKGDCRCLMLSEGTNVRQQYTLSAPRLTVDLFKGKSEASTDSGFDIKHLTADGGPVNLSTVRTAQDKILGGIELKCPRFDYDAVNQLFLATGPGVIKLDNSNVSATRPARDKFSLKRPCWAFVRNFQTLRYSLQVNTLIADAGLDEPLRVDYFPIDAGRVQYNRQAIVTAARVEADLVETGDEQLELATLTASSGVTYQGDRQFEGGTLFYDAIQSLVTVQADELYPCYLDSVHVDAIEWDLETGNLKFEVVGLGAL